MSYFAERAERLRMDLLDAAIGAMQAAIAASFSKEANEALALARRKRAAKRREKTEPKRPDDPGAWDYGKEEAD